MGEGAPGEILARWSRRLSGLAGEIIHACAVYLGIAVLVGLVLAVSLPSVREQSRVWHAAVLAALRADDSAAATAVAARAPAESGVETGSPPEMWTAVAAGGELALPGVGGAQSKALQAYIARKYKIARSVAGVLIQSAYQVGEERGLDPLLLLAVIAIESRYNPYAESHVGAQGLMQVMTRVHRDKFEAYDEGAAAALHPIANMRVGAQILDDCIQRRGSVEGGLRCYVGASGPGDGGYGAKVLAERRRIVLASGIGEGVAPAP